MYMGIAKNFERNLFDIDDAPKFQKTQNIVYLSFKRILSEFFSKYLKLYTFKVFKMQNFVFAGILENSE